MFNILILQGETSVGDTRVTNIEKNADIPKVLW